MKNKLRSIIGLTVLFAFIFSTLIVYTNADTPSENANMPNPVGLYSFEDTDNIGKDTSGNNNDLKAIGSATQVEGKFKKAVSFDGTNALHTSPDGDGFDYVDKLDKLTVASFVKVASNLDSAPASNRFIDNGHNGAFKGGFTISMLTDGNGLGPIVGLADENNHYWGHGNAEWIQYTEQWVHIALSIDTATNKTQFYINGELKTEKTHNYNVNIKCKEILFSLGAQTINDDAGLRILDSESFEGALDEVRVYDVILDSDQVKKLLTLEPKEPVEPPVPDDPELVKANLLAHYGFEDAKQPGKDSSGNNNHLDYYSYLEDGYVKMSEDFPLENGKVGKAASFDGDSFLVYNAKENEKDFVDSLDAITVTYLIKNRKLVGEEAAAVNGWLSLVNNGGNAGVGWTINCAYDGDSSANNFSVITDVDNNQIISQSGALIEGISTEWNRVTFTINSKTKTSKCYLNDILVTEFTVDKSFIMSCLDYNFAIGANVLGADGEYVAHVGNSYIGYLDEVSVFDTELSAYQIANIDKLAPISLKSTSDKISISNNNVVIKKSDNIKYKDVIKALGIADIENKDTAVKFIDASGKEIEDFEQIAADKTSIIFTVNKVDITKYTILFESSLPSEDIPTTTTSETDTKPTDSSPDTTSSQSPDSNVSTGINTLTPIIILLAIISVFTIIILNKRQKNNNEC